MIQSTRFPENSGVLLVWITVLETIAGALKRRLQPIWVFWVGLSIQVVCAIIVATALVLQLLQGEYSGLETTAAILSLTFATLVSIMEAVVVYKARTLFTNNDKNQSMIAAAAVCVVLMLTAFPIYVGIWRQVSWEAFNSHVMAIILLAITLPPAFSAFLLVPIFVIYLVESEPIDVNRTPDLFSFLCNMMLMLYFSVLGLVLLIPFPLTLGMFMLFRGDNMSLSVLVLGNIFPCLALALSSLFLIPSSESQTDHEYHVIQ